MDVAIKSLSSYCPKILFDTAVFVIDLSANLTGYKIRDCYPAVTESAPQDTHIEELQKEILELEKKLREKQNELFQIQRYTFRHKCHPVKMTTETFMRPQVI